ncbi:MAG: hypothetical protein U5K38_11460 [Woeseiaceae bacterium]|nr:hypothetical protein [Woeseiaceae bacterium]
MKAIPALCSLALMIFFATSIGSADTTAEQPETAAEIVVALIEAIRDEDRERAEMLHVADGSRWHDAESFTERADFYRSVDFDFESISQWSAGGGWLKVAVPGTQDGHSYLYVFMVGETDGALRAGGMERRLAGMP